MAPDAGEGRKIAFCAVCISRPTRGESDDRLLSRRPLKPAMGGASCLVNLKVSQAFSEPTRQQRKKERTVEGFEAGHTVQKKPTAASEVRKGRPRAVPSRGLISFWA